MTESAWRTAGLAIMMAIWWSTEPVPIGVTALLPLIVLPLAGVGDIGAAAAPYANPLVFLFMGGFLLAEGLKRWGLHRRLAYAVVRRAGLDSRRLILGFMAATALLSMWISNTSAVVLMLPIATSVIGAVARDQNDEDAHRFALALLLGVAYAASIGGVGTLIGTPPNALMAGYLSEQHGIDLSFAAWAAIAMPLVVVFLPLAWLLLTKIVFPIRGCSGSPGGAGGLDALRVPGMMTRAERRVGIVFICAALLWIARPALNQLPGLENLSDPAIALGCGAILFLIPSGMDDDRRFLMTWREAREIRWQVLILFGGGLSLASAMDGSGLAAWIGHSLGGLGGLPDLIFLLIVTAAVVMLTEMASNTAVVAGLLPIVGTIAAGSGMDIVGISAAITMAASCAFMLPVATPPNALVFATGHVTVAAMMRAGLVMNLVSVGLVSLVVSTLTSFVLKAG